MGTAAAADGAVLDLSRLAAAKVKNRPFRHVLVEQFVPPEALRDINRDFPKALMSTEFASRKNVEEVDVVKTGQVKGSYAALLKAVRAKELRDALSAKLRMDLSGTSTRVTLRGACRPKPCGGPGSIHTDSKCKVVSALIYLNLPNATDHGNLLLLSGSGRSKPGLGAVAVEVPSFGGNLVAFRNAPTAWHALRPFVGVRRAVQVNFENAARCPRVRPAADATAGRRNRA